MFFRYLKIGAAVGVIYAMAFLIFEDLWTLTALKGEFTLKQIFFSVVLYTLIFGSIGALSGFLLFITSKPSNRAEKPVITPTLLLLIGFAAYCLEGYKLIRLPFSPQIAVLTSLIIWIVVVFIIIFIVLKLLRIGFGSSRNVVDIRGAAVIAFFMVLFILNAKMNKDLVVYEKFADYRWLWWMFTLFLSAAVFLLVKSAAKTLVRNVPESYKAIHYLRNITSSLILTIFFWGLLVTLINGKQRFSPVDRESSNGNGLNVILIIIDALHADHMSLYGYERLTTKWIDEYSTRGVVFSHALANSSWTKPSISSLFTSRYPGMNGIETFADIFPSELVTLAEVLGKNGYYNKGISTNALITPTLNYDQGFHEFIYFPGLGKR